MSWFKKLFSRSKKKVKLVMIGLDNAGKTTILNYLKVGSLTKTIPTIGVNYETFKFKNLNFNCYDLGGQVSFRQFWKEAAQDCNALIFVVDSTDKDRMEESKKELNEIISNDLPPKVPIIIFSNKIDLPDHVQYSEIAKIFNLPVLEKRNWHIQETSAVTGFGFIEGIVWLYQELTGEKIVLPFKFTDIIIFNKDGSVFLTMEQITKKSSSKSKFVSTLNTLIGEIIDKKLGSLVLQDHKFIFIHGENFITCIIINKNESETTAKDIILKFANKIDKMDHSDAKLAFERFLSEQKEAML
ncbi:MAG: ADP-ribosylation factor family protein [Candidatus Helarchaeota archaeon]